MAGAAVVIPECEGYCLEARIAVLCLSSAHRVAAVSPPRALTGAPSMAPARGNIVHSNFQRDAILWNGKSFGESGNHLGSGLD